MKFLRRISTPRLLALCASVVVVAAGAAVAAIAATGGGPVPPPKSLPVAVHDALSAPAVPGVSARIRFTNNLVSGADVQGSDPLLNGASGRLWASPDGRLRLELQSDLSHGGTADSQVLVDRRRVTLYDGSSNTAYEATLPTGQADRSARKRQVPSIARIRSALVGLAKHAIVSGAVPSDVAGRPAYTVRIAPRRHAGLLGGAKLAWDAVHGTPLRFALYAKGSSSPVLELEATDISFGPVSSSVFDVTPPAGAKVTKLSAPTRGSAPGHAASEVDGLAAVARRVSFKPAAPAQLASRRRSGAHLVSSGKDASALVTYGRGPSGIAVLETPASGRSGSGSISATGEQPGLRLPSVRINGARGQELDTALGTLVRFQRNGVEYTVVGSVPPAVARAAARGL
jgi:outer membrane lipoprotein-sorting protein